MRFLKADVSSVERCNALHLFQQSVILAVGADPEPDNAVVVNQPQSTPPYADAHGEYRRLLADTFEIETGMVWIDFPEAVILARLLLNTVGKAAKATQKIRREFRVHSSSNPLLRVLPARRARRALAASFSSKG